MKQKIPLVALVLVATFLLIKCNKIEKGPFASYDPFAPDKMSECLKAYCEKDVVLDDHQDGSMQVYVDFSDGMVNAYQGNTNNLEMIKALANKFTTKACFYKLASGVIDTMQLSFNEIYNKVTDPKAYSTEIMAPIEDAIKRITEANQETLLVTDFEEYTTDGKEQFRAYADKYFTNWLKKGNSITFYVSNFKEKKIDKHLYFIVFSTSANTLKRNVEYAWAGRNLIYQTFTLSTDFYKFETNYPAATKGGEYFDNDGNSIILCTNSDYYINACAHGYEYYPVQSNWNDILYNAKAMMEPGTPKPFTHLLRNLFVNFQNMDSYKVESLGIKVSDVTDDFRFYTECQEVKNHQPKMTVDPSGNKVFAVDNDEIALTCYDKNGTLKKEWNYSAKSTKEISDAFILDDELFANTNNVNPEKTEIGIKFHSNFDGSQIAKSSGLLRIDIVMEDCSPNVDNLDSLFTWNSTTKKGEVNTSLRESIRNVLQELNPQGEAIYSYFIKCI